MEATKRYKMERETMSNPTHKNSSIIPTTEKSQRFTSTSRAQQANDGPGIKGFSDGFQTGPRNQPTSTEKCRKNTPEGFLNLNGVITVGVVTAAFSDQQRIDL